MDIVIGIILIAAALFLIVAVLLQSNKDDGLSATITGSSSDTYYGKNKGNTMDRMLSKITAVIAVIFVGLVLVSFVIQDDDDINKNFQNITTKAEETTVAESNSTASTTDASDSTTEAGKATSSETTAVDSQTTVS